MQLTLRQAARYLAVPEDALEKWAERGELPAVRINDQYRFNRVDLLEWAAERHLTVSPEILAEPGGPQAGELPRLADCIRAGGVHVGVEGADKETLLRNVVGLLPLPRDVPPEFLLEMLLAREKLGSTALGSGIAIPHPREPLVMHVHEPLVSVCMLAQPVDFGSTDGMPVHTLLVIVAPSVRAHLHVLSRLSAVLHDGAVRAKLESRAPADALLAEIERVEAAQARARDEGLARSDRP
jgi:PTS system nitrogen regulatory IIA component